MLFRSVEIRGCHVSWIPTRGFLLSTRRKVIVEENEFSVTHMSAILLAIDGNNWFESGPVHDMTIRNNKFTDCGEPVILLEPGNKTFNNSVNRNIQIENNEFILRDRLMVKAKSTNNLVVSGNTIYTESGMDDKTSIKTEDCDNVVILNNKYLNLK